MEQGKHDEITKSAQLTYGTERTLPAGSRPISSIPSMLRTLLLFLISASPLLAGETKCEITLVPQNDSFQSWYYNRDQQGFCADVEIHFTPPFTGTLEYAACSTIDPAQKWRVHPTDPDYLLKDIATAKSGNLVTGLQFFSIRNPEMADWGEGTFLFAILVDGHRYSNVIRVTIKHDYDAKVEPPLRVFAIQPLEGNSIRQIGVWVVPPVFDKKLTNMVASSIDLSIDGKWHSCPIGMWDGLVYSLKPGISTATNCFLEMYSPPITPFKHAKVQARLLDFTSQITDLAVDPSEATQFDRAFGL